VNDVSFRHCTLEIGYFLSTLDWSYSTIQLKITNLLLFVDLSTDNPTKKDSFCDFN